MTAATVTVTEAVGGTKLGAFTYVDGLGNTVKSGASVIVDANGNPFISTNPLAVQQSVGGAVASAANPVPVQVSVGGAVATAANPIPNQPSIGGVVVSSSNPLPVTGHASDLVGTTQSAANTTITLTLAAAGAGLFHYITSITISRVNDSVTDLAGSFQLAYTSTNLNGWTRHTGNACLKGQLIIDVALMLPFNPMKSAVANTATTIVIPACGAGVRGEATVTYYTGP